jgi:sulfofructose kinase
MSERVVCVGIAVLDQIYTTPRLPTGDGKMFADSYHEVGGGPGLPMDADAVPPGSSTEPYRHVSHALYSRQGLAGFTGIDHVEKGLASAEEKIGAWVGVTDGADGIYWRQDGAMRHLPAFAVPVVDTLGAGDVCHGAFALALARGWPVGRALRFAAAAAALKCTRPGGRDGIPDAESVDAFLKKQG